MTNPKVSILIPIYGVEQYIERCAISLFEQSYDNIEYIFVDDATKDDSVAVLERVIDRYPNRKPAAKIIHHPVNKGISAARNTAVAVCTGDYLIHVDSDDYIATQAVKHLVERAITTNADIVLFDTTVLTNNGVIIRQVSYSDKTTYIKRLLQHTEQCAHWNKFYRSEFYKQSGIRGEESVRFGEDYAVTPRIVHEARTITVLHEPLYFYETRNQSSYMHNLSRSAIESHYQADKVLVDWFHNVSDASLYKDVVDVLPIRSMVSLIKNSDQVGWIEITDVYQEYLSLSGHNMTMVNRIIYYLVQRQQWITLQYFMQFYHFIMHDRK